MKKVHLIGNAHLDPVWLWQWQEGFSEVKATFRSALDRMNEFPDFQFTSACAAYYQWIEQVDPDMFAEIQQRVKEGRWHIVGGWFIQPDCNIPCGESFARHALVSQRYFKKKFGVIAHTGYNVDSFGHNGSLPQILRQSGMENYIFMRPMPHEKELPASAFEWESADGSRVTTYRIPFYYNIDVHKMESFQRIADMDEPTDMMAFFGVGNHGGGATVALLNAMKEELGDNFVQSDVDTYFASLDKESLPVVRDDLQFHAKGCYSACSQIKIGNRRSENGLLACEKYSVLAGHAVKFAYPAEELNRGWKNVLFNHFHDIMGGCSIREAYDDAAHLHHEALAIADRNTNMALQRIAWNIDTMDGKDCIPYKYEKIIGAAWHCDENIGTPLVVFNSLDHEVESVVHIRELVKAVRDDEGNLVPSQKVRDSKSNGAGEAGLFGTAFLAKVPAYGWRVYRLYFAEEEVGLTESAFTCSDTVLENELLRVEFSPVTGEISCIFDKTTETEKLGAPTQTLFMDETRWDTWAHGAKEFKTLADRCIAGSVRLIENGAVRATVRSTQKVADTTIVRDYTLWADRAEIVVNTYIDFHEKHKMLKFAVPQAVTTDTSLCEIPFGSIARATDGAEQVGGAWAALPGGLGMANSGQYSFDADKNVLSLTVLRGAIYVDHFGKRDEFCVYMEQGEHRFTYTIFPFSTASDAAARAAELNQPPVAVAETFHHGSLGTSYTGMELSASNIQVTAVKQAEEGDALIVRAYETDGQDTDVTVRVLDTTFTTHFAHDQIKTFRIEGGNVREVNFMEY